MEEEFEEEEAIEPKKSITKRILKIFLWFAGSLIGLLLLAYVLLSIPPVQNAVVKFVVEQLEKKLDTKASIGEIRLKLFTRVAITDIYIEDRKQDTLLYAHSLDVGLSPWNLMKGELKISGIDLDDFLINVNKNDSISDYNFQFIVNAFSSTDTTQVDTASTNGISISIEDINIKHGRINYDILSDTITPTVFNTSHLSLTDVTASLSLNSIDIEKLDVLVENLSAKEQSGVEIKCLSGQVRSQGSNIWGENLFLELPSSHLRLDSICYDLDKQSFLLEVNDTKIYPHDLIAFMPELRFLKDSISLKTKIQGTLPAIEVQTLDITYANELTLSASATISDYAEYGNADINLSIDKFKVSQTGIKYFTKLGDSTLVLPTIVTSLGDIYLKGKLNGKLEDLNLDAETWSRQGLISLSAKGSTDTTFTKFDVKARLNTKNFNLASLLGTDTGLGKLGMYVNLSAKQTNTNNLTAQIQGAVDYIEYDSIRYSQIPFSAYYNPKEMGFELKTTQHIGKIKGIAKMSNAKIPDISFYLAVDTLHADSFYKNEKWKNPLVSLRLQGDLKGSDIDYMSGTIKLDSLKLQGEGFSFAPGLISLNINTVGKENKNIKLSSSLLSADLSGQYNFATLPDDINYLMNGYLSNLFPETKKKIKRQNNLMFDITVNNTESYGSIFQLPVDIVEPISIKGKIDAIDRVVDIKGNVPLLRSDGMMIKETILDVSTKDTAFVVAANTSIETENGKYGLSLKMNGAENSVRTFFNVKSDWIKNQNFNIDGGLDIMAQFSRPGTKKDLVPFFQLYSTNLNIGKLKLTILPARIVNIEGRTQIENFGLAILENRKKYIQINGSVSKNPEDSLTVSFDHSQVGDLLAAFDVNNIKACIDGNLIFKNMLDKPEFFTDKFRIHDITLFSDTLGTLALESKWNETDGAAHIKSTLEKENKKVINVSGLVYTAKDSIDMNVDIDRLSINWVQPFVATALNRFTGTLSSNIKVSDKLSSPVISGFLGLNDAYIGIDYTNVTYNISDTIDISPDHVGFKNLILKDNDGNTANMNLTLSHENFENIKFNADMTMNNLLALNTPLRTDSMFYGKLYASGQVNITGDKDNVDMKMNLRNGKNSILNILLPQTSEASDYKSVVYINVPEEKKVKENLLLPRNTESLPLKMNIDLNLNLNKDMNMTIYIDPSSGTELSVSGNGKINFGYDMSNNNMSTLGDYTLNQGKVKVSLQGLKKLEFDIKEGSKLTFLGDPMRTAFDIFAYRRLRADLKTLDASFASDMSTTRVNGDCILHISGNINKKTLSYDIDLPNSSDDVKQKLRSLISTDEQKIKQFAYLIAFSSFYSGDGGAGGNLGDGVLTSLASSTLSGGLNALFGNMLGNNWEIGTNIESNDGTLSNMDMSVNVSTRLFDDKLKLNTNLGYRTSQISTENTFIGDFEVEYALNNLWTLKFYNKTNDAFYRQAPTTQGIGVVYTKEARTLKQLFQSLKPRRWRDPQAGNTESTLPAGNNNRPKKQETTTESK